MTTEKTLFQIDIRYNEPTNSNEMQALADELIKRGHTVNVKKYSPRGSFVDDLTRSARDFKDLADNVRGAAENGIQILKEVAESLVKPTEPNTKQNNNTEQNTADTIKQEENTETHAGFDDIGPAAAAANRVASNHAIIVTCPEALADQSLDAMRIGLIPKTILDHTWQPAELDAIVIPHTAFRPYLETIHWNPEHIFEGAYVALKSDCPTKTREEAQKHFQLKREAGPIVLVMASGIPNHELQTLMIQLSLLKMPMQVFFYHAGDSYKAEQLRALAQKFAVNARMFGRVNNLPDYLAMADIAVAHVNDANIQLLQNAGVPIACIALKDIPANINFLSHERTALIAPEIYKLSATLATPLTDPNMMQAMQTAAANIAQLANIEKCADAIEAALAKKNQIIPNPAQRMTTTDGFEVIGTQVNPNSFLTPQYQTAMTSENVNSPAQTAPTQLTSVQNTQPAPAMLQPNLAAPTQPAIGMPGMMPTHNQGAIQPPPQMLTPGLGARSKEDIKAEYTKLLLVEKSLDKSLDAASADVRKWEERLDLARQANRDDLVTSAIASLQAAQSQEMSLFQQKDQIQQQKSLLKQSARLAGSQTTPDATTLSIGQIEDELFGPSREELALEKEFSKLQKEGALQRLKNKLGK